MTDAKCRVAVLRTGVALTALLVSSSAFAGGLAIREQSTAGQGASFAGIAAGGAPSAMFWNPATMTQFPGTTMESGGTFLLPRSEQTPFTTSLPAPYGGGISNSADFALIPNSYSVWQYSPNIWLGLSTNSPFGLSVGFQNPIWAGAAYGQSSSLKTYNATPSIAFKLADWISVGAGVQIQYARATFAGLNLPTVPPNLFLVGGSGWGWGWTAGVTLTPWSGTQLGVGYRSQINQDIDGQLSITPAGLATPGSVSTTLRLPDMVTVGLRQRINDQFTLLAGFEWSNWSRIGTVNIQQPNGATATTFTGAGITLPFQWRDGYMYSGGFEYKLNPTWTGRAGFAFEQSPVTDTVRTPRLPDSDRYWYSVGLTNMMTDRLSVDFAYSYIDFKNAPINITATSGNPSFNGLISYTGQVESHIHLLSASIRYKM
jgi:long-chain fatty acid transport protein